MTKRSAAGPAAVVALVLLAGCGQMGAGIAPGAPGSASTTTARPNGTSSITPDSNKSAAWHRVRQVLADAPVLPAAHPVGHPPVAALKKPSQSIASPNVVTATRWWTAPGSLSAALRYVRAHPPAGTRVDGSGVLNTPDAVAKSVTFDGPLTNAYSQLTLVMDLTQLQHGVAVRAEVEALWLPARTPAEHVDPKVSSVAVTVTRPGVAKTVHRIVKGHRVSALAAVVNRLPVWPPGTYNCPADRGFVDKLVFHGPGPDVAVRADIGGCSTVSVTVGHRSQPTLAGAGLVDAAVVKALDLPRTYSR